MRAPLIVLILVAGLANLLPASEQLYLTGIIQMGAYQRAVVMEYPSLHSYLLVPGKNVAGLKLLGINSQTGVVRIQRDGEELTLELPDLRKGTNALSGYLAGGELPPDYSGPWPAGYEPELIRQHRAGLLKGGANPVPLNPDRNASPEYLAAIRKYTRGVPEEEREPLVNALRQYAGAPTMTSDGASVAKETANPVSNDAIQEQSPEELLQHILNTPPPAAGALAGTPADVITLRQLWRQQADPMVRQRIQQEIMGYAANPATERSGLAVF
ncbi:MAG: hypothetical protein WCO56_21330 [Verrucomicrobiota bacterium]